MGCASSTPMIATAGSEMLKTASHVATDAAKSAEDAVEDVTQSLGKSLDTAKETVGTAITGVANDIGNAFKEKTEMLDDAAKNLMGKLHIGDKPEEELNVEKMSTTETEMKHPAADHHETSSVKDDDDAGAMHSEHLEDNIPTRAPSPTAEHDADSLKTSTPEPEIEQALANCIKDSPPTPKPTIAELAKLTKETVDKAATAKLANETETMKEKVTQAIESVNGGENKTMPSGEPPVE